MVETDTITRNIDPRNALSHASNVSEKNTCIPTVKHSNKCLNYRRKVFYMRRKIMKTQTFQRTRQNQPRRDAEITHKPKRCHDVRYPSTQLSRSARKNTRGTIHTAETNRPNIWNLNRHSHEPALTLNWNPCHGTLSEKNLGGRGVGRNYLFHLDNYVNDLTWLPTKTSIPF